MRFPSPGFKVALAQRGFTVLELIMVAAVVAILASIAAPSMRNFLLAADVRGASSDFYAALALARSEAIKRHDSITVAPKGINWLTGWDVKTSGGTTLQTADPLASDVAATPGTPSNVVFGTNGRVSSGAQTVVFFIAGNTSIAARCVAVDINGMPRMRTDSNKDPADGCN